MQQWQAHSWTVSFLSTLLKFSSEFFFQILKVAFSRSSKLRSASLKQRYFVWSVALMDDSKAENRVERRILPATDRPLYEDS